MPRKNKKNILSKKDLTKSLYLRLDKQIEERLIFDSITYIFSFITESISENKDVLIKNFGTFSVKKDVKNGYEFLYPTFYPQPILKKIVKNNFKLKKESNYE